MKKFNHYLISFLLLFISLGVSQSLKAQFFNGTQVEFGKSRVQYDDFEWQYYRFAKFETYFYTGGKDLAVHAAKYVNVRIPQIEKFLDFYAGEPIQLVIYNKQSHFRQSNIGLTNDLNQNLGGVTNLVGSKLFVYFEGDYESFEKQIDAGLYRVLIYQMIYSAGWREVLLNSSQATLPDWYLEGLVSFLNNPDDPIINAQIRDGIISGEFEKFNSLNENETVIASHGIWKYIAQTYGKNVISNILYMIKVSKKVDEGFLYVIGVPFKQLYEDWIASETETYSLSKPKNYESPGEQLEIKSRKNRKYQNFVADPYGNYLAFSTNKMGQYKVYFHDLRTKKTTKIFKDEHKLERIQDYSYPIMRWHPSGKLLTFITEEKGDILFFTYNVETGELAQKPIFKIEKVLSYSYLEDGKKFVFSGVNEGQTDLYLYNVLGNTQNKITDDVYDDLDPVINKEGNKVYFVSNRLNDSLNVDHMPSPFSHERDIFVLNINENKENTIQSVTDTDGLDEVAPVLINGEINYLRYDGNSTLQYKARYDSAISKIDTVIHYRYFYNSTQTAEYKMPIISQSPTTDNVVYQYTLKNGKYRFYEKQWNASRVNGTLDSKGNNNNVKTKRARPVESFQTYETTEPKLEIDFRNYQFNNKRSATSKPAVAKKTEEAEYDELEFPTQRIYRYNFKVNKTRLQLDYASTSIGNQYQNFNGGPYVNSGISPIMGVEIVDLMENHKIYGAFRFNYSFDNFEYLLGYKNLTKRLDKEYIAFRSTERFRDFATPVDIKTLSGTIKLNYPFSEVTSLRGGVSLRNDQVVPLSTSRGALELDRFSEYYASAVASYVFDNTREIETNIRFGTKYKIFAEYYKKIYSGNENSQESDLQVIGFDFRHYQKVHRNIIAVGRLAGSRSFGKTPLIYYLGGVDQWWQQNIFDGTTPIDFTQNYRFQALAANLRGFRQNVRNGNSFVVINTELRWPIFSYFIKRPIQSKFVRDFQLIGFGDVGTAWVGDSPYADDNPLNNETLSNEVVTVTYENINEPIVGGVGFGLRSTLFGYFVRADFAWGIENGVINKDREFMLSLTLDI